MPAMATTTGGRARTLQAILLAVALVVASLALGVARARPAGAAYPVGPGYWLFATDGGVFSFGDAQFQGSTGNIRLNQPMVGAAALPFLEGYWMVASDGGVFTFGDARFFGSTGNIRLNKPIVGMSPIPSGQGYRLVATDGGVFSFGAARFLGSTGNMRLNQPVVGMATEPFGGGYWLVATDGGIFAFGDARFFGSTGNIRLNQPIVGMAATPTGNGYWLVASDGGIFAFGDAAFHGSTGNIRLNQPIIAMAARPPLALKVDPFDAEAPGRSQTWARVGDDPQLVLTWNGAGDVPAGARVIGVEGLGVDQLGELSFVVEGGSCAAEPRFNLYVDTNGDGAGDTTRTYTCSAGGTGTTKRFNPVAGAVGAAPLARTGTVTGLDVLLGSAGTNNLDDITAARINVRDHRTFTAVDTAIG